MLTAAALMTVSCGSNGTSPRTVLFLGDSITEEEYYVRDIETVFNKETARPPRVVVRGRNSETISGLTEKNFPGDRPYLFDKHNLASFSSFMSVGFDSDSLSTKAKQQPIL